MNKTTGEVFVSDQNNNRVQVFDSSGNFLREWGSSGSGPGQLSLPYGIALDADGNAYVAEMGNNRVQKFSSTGASLGMWGSVGTGNGQFKTPTGVLVAANGNVYVSDGLNHRIQIFTPAGGFLGKWGSFGSATGQFRVPMGLAQDGDGNLYVADQGNARVQKFNLGGGFLLAWGDRGLSDTEFAFPQDVAVDGADQVFVTDMANHRVKQYDKNGNLVVIFGNQGSADGQFNYPVGIAVDGFDNLFVSEMDNSRVQKFGTSPTQPTNVQTLIDIDPQVFPNTIVPGTVQPIAVAVLGSELFDVSLVQPGSITLEGIAPIEMTSHDLVSVGTALPLGDAGTPGMQSIGCTASFLGPDGFADLILEFRAEDILSMMEGLQPGESRQLTLSGTLAGGGTFTGADCMSMPANAVGVDDGGFTTRLEIQGPTAYRSAAHIVYSLADRMPVRLRIYDVAGRRIAGLVDDFVERGTHSVDWNGAGSSGIYFVRLDAGEQTLVRRIALRN